MLHTLTFLEATVLEREGRGLGVAMDLTSKGEKVEELCVVVGEELNMKGVPLQMEDAEVFITISFFLFFLSNFPLSLW